MQGYCHFRLASLKAWAPGIDSPEDWLDWANGQRDIASEGTPPVAAMPAMLRRRLDRLGRMALETAYATLGEQRDIPMLFCSRHGELARSASLLQELAKGNPLSPMAFSTSVHNAIMGLFTIARQEGVSGSALSAGKEGVMHALLEACALLADGSPGVLLVSYDDLLPACYQSFADEIDRPYAWAALLTNAQGDPYDLRWQRPTATSSSDQTPQALSLLRFLLRKESQLRLPGLQREWIVSRVS